MDGLYIPCYALSGNHCFLQVKNILLQSSESNWLLSFLSAVEKHNYDNSQGAHSLNTKQTMPTEHALRLLVA